MHHISKTAWVIFEGLFTPPPIQNPARGSDRGKRHEEGNPKGRALYLQQTEQAKKLLPFCYHNIKKDGKRPCKDIQLISG